MSSTLIREKLGLLYESMITDKHNTSIAPCILYKWRKTSSLNILRTLKIPLHTIFCIHHAYLYSHSSPTIHQPSIDFYKRQHEKYTTNQPMHQSWWIVQLINATWQWHLSSMFFNSLFVLPTKAIIHNILKLKRIKNFHPLEYEINFTSPKGETIGSVRTLVKIITLIFQFDRFRHWYSQRFIFYLGYTLADHRLTFYTRWYTEDVFHCWNTATHG